MLPTGIDQRVREQKVINKTCFPGGNVLDTKYFTKFMIFRLKLETTVTKICKDLTSHTTESPGFYTYLNMLKPIASNTKLPYKKSF